MNAVVNTYLPSVECNNIGYWYTSPVHRVVNDTHKYIFTSI